MRVRAIWAGTVAVPALFLFAAAVFGAAGSCAAAAEDLRSSLPLDGAWEAAEAAVPVVELAGTVDKAPAAGWKAFTVPGTTWGEAKGGGKCMWYRRTVQVPAGWGDRRIFVRLGGARWAARVYLDGKFVAERLEGFTPWEVELTGLAKEGGSHRLEVRCRDWSATFADGYRIPAGASGDLREVPPGKVLAPVGGQFTAYGLWNSVSLVAKPKAFLDDVAIDTSVRKRTLSVTGAVEGGSAGMSVSAEVLEAGKAVITIPPVAVKDGRWRLSVPWAAARLWSPEDPHLYVLRLTLGSGNAPADSVETRFGFRELWTEGPDFVLNGVKRHLLATSNWPSLSPMTRDQVREVIRQLKKGNNVAFRQHTQPWQEVWMEVADEEGIMMIIEGALWCTSGSYAYADRRFWDNYRTHLAGVVRRDRNHASLVMWSLENELLHCGAGRNVPETEQQLARLGRFVKELDPTHLITFESDMDPGGVADVIGLHYPHELPYFYDYPNTCDWLGGSAVTGTEGGLMGSRGAEFRWDRKKPLYIGEYLWVPTGDGSPGTVFFGDETYSSVPTYDYKAKALSWEDQTLAYRRAGVSGLCPWTECGGAEQRFPQDLNPSVNGLYQAQTRAYEPVAVYVREKDTRFFAGDPVVRTLEVFNDSVRERKLEVRWKFGRSTGARSLVLPPAGYAPVRADLKAPGASPSVPFTVELLDGGKAVHSARQECSVVRRGVLKAPAGARLMAWDPGGAFTALLKRRGLKARRLASLGDLPPDPSSRDILILAPGALKGTGAAGSALPKVGAGRGEEAAIKEFVRTGGGVLILEQETLDPLGLGLELVPHPSTMTFPLGTHPLLEGIPAGDLSFWRDDNYVTRLEIRRTPGGGRKAVVVSGGPEGLDQAPVMDVAAGKGVVLAVQMLVGRKLDREPVAGRILENALKYLAAFQPPAARTNVAGNNRALNDRLAALGFAYSSFGLPARPGLGDLPEGGLFICDGGGNIVTESAQEARGFLEAGGTMYWHSPVPEAFVAVLKKLGAPAATIQPVQGPLLVRDASHPVLSGVAREDLDFRGDRGGPDWSRQRDPDPTVVDSAVAFSLPLEGAARFEAEKMEHKGFYVNASSDGKTLGFFTNGSADFTADIPEAGMYAIGVLAGGTPHKGVFPIVTVSAGDRIVGQVALSAAEQKRYDVFADLPKGRLKFRVEFTNDGSDAKEDRNLFLDAVLVGGKPLREFGVTVLTLPASLVVIPVGKGRLVVDCVRWDTNERNRTRGDRYVTALLRNLGAELRSIMAEPDWVPAAGFEKASEMQYWGKSDKEFRFSSAGDAVAPFECVAAGTYEVTVTGKSDPCKGIYAIAEVEVDGVKAGEVEVRSTASQSFRVTPGFKLEKGKHKVLVRFTNDQFAAPEDRNFYLNAVGFRKVL